MAEDRMLSDEVLLALIKKNSGGGGGTTNYNQLANKPQIGGVTLTGNKTASDLGLATESALANKADKSAVKNEFIGTLEQWNALTAEQRKAYDTYQITDDFISGNSTNYLYNGEAEPKNFTMPSGTAMQPLFTGKYGMDFKGGAGDFIRVATSKTAIDFTGISKLRFVGLHYESFDVLMGSFIEDVDVTNITGYKYLSVGYKTTMQNNSAVYAITDTATVTSSDTVAIKTKTGATNVSMFTQIIAE